MPDPLLCPCGRHQKQTKMPSHLPQPGLRQEVDSHVQKRFYMNTNAIERPPQEADLFRIGRVFSYPSLTKPNPRFNRKIQREEFWAQPRTTDCPRGTRVGREAKLPPPHTRIINSLISKFPQAYSKPSNK